MSSLYKHARSHHQPQRLVWMMVFGLLIVLAMAALPWTLWKMFIEEDSDRARWWGIAALASVTVGVAARLSIFGQSGRVRCPLCQGELFRARRCRKHINARKYFLMSYNASMLVDLFTRGAFLCKYCGTPYSLMKSFRKQRAKAQR